MKIEINRLIEEKEYCRDVFNFFINKEIIKKTNPALFEKHLNKSLNNLEFGNFVLSEHNYSIKKKLKGKSFYDWCVVIYYYAIYHAVLALISKAGFESKNHLASISALTYIYYHKKNLLNKEDIQMIIDNFNIKGEEIEFIANSKEMREKASYRVDEDFGIALAEDMRKKTVDFVNKIKMLLEEKELEDDEDNEKSKEKDKLKKEVKNE
ncbi:MAG: hypothetical protein KKE50_04555 [Nanoarchaeota archaeon]|nr:hypothetical protein [Nanoarchaeota archaeon]